MTEKEKRSLKIRLGKRLSYDKSRVMEIVKEEIDKTETTMEQPHGEWKQITEPDIWGKTKYQCSVCKYVHRHSEFDTISFCEDCGADMRKEGEGK